MLFRPELCDKILKKEKTQTRRIKKPGERLIIYPDRRKAVVAGILPGVLNGRIKWVTGCTYAIQPGRGKPAVGRFRLLDIREERLQDITIEGIKAEGVEPTDAPGLIFRHDNYEYFKAWEWTWDSINNKSGQRFEDNPEVWVLVFELVEVKR